MESPSSRKRRAPETGLENVDAAVARAGVHASAPAFTLELDEASRAMTVEEFMRAHLASLIDKANALTDELVDAFSLQYRALREEVQHERHVRRIEAAARSKAGRKKLWDVRVTVLSSVDEDMVGSVHVLRPRPGTNGMVKIGRSTGDAFKGDKGMSLAKDASVSTWHGKLTCVCGSIYFTDLQSKNGSKHNGERVEKDEPVALRNMDTLTLGDTTLQVELIPASAGEPEADSTAAAKPGHGL